MGKKKKVNVSDFGMKWYKFLIYFALFASALLNVISAILYFSGNVYKNSGTVYKVFPKLQMLDSLYGVALIVFAIFALVVRSALANYKGKAPKLLIRYYLISGLVSFIYLIAASVIVSDSRVSVGTSAFVIVLGSILGAVINAIYFKKRAVLFYKK
ncbi:MAG: hypothetical protein E7637_05860 [Ruminococcaceae bacterium]|nr:hypothetical protein [Oscillospiraceae bacterium]